MWNWLKIRPNSDDDENVLEMKGPLRSFPLKENISYELGQCQHSSSTQLICQQLNTKMDTMQKISVIDIRNSVLFMITLEKQ